MIAIIKSHAIFQSEDTLVTYMIAFIIIFVTITDSQHLYHFR